MSIQLPSVITEILPLVLSATVVLAVVALTYSLVLLITQRLPVAGSQGGRSPRSHVGMVFRSAARFGWMSLWLLVTALHLMAWQLWSAGDSKYVLHGFSYGASLIAILLSWQLWKSSRPAHWVNAGGISMQLLQVLGLVYCSNLMSREATVECPQKLPGTLVVCKIARTDGGTPIHLYDRQVERNDLDKFFFETRSQVTNLTRQAMFREEAEPQINCHGWVFNGQHIIKGEDVPIILEENGYQQVDEPRTHDLVVYFDPNDAVLHTGLVGGFFKEIPLVESKWGINGIYVHLVHEQPYSAEYRFYRSAREGHQLHDCDATAVALAPDLKPAVQQNLISYSTDAPGSSD